MIHKKRCVYDLHPISREDSDYECFLLHQRCNWNFANWFCHLNHDNKLEMVSTRTKGGHKVLCFKTYGEFVLWVEKHCETIMEFNPSKDYHRAKWTHDFINKRFESEGFSYRV